MTKMFLVYEKNYLTGADVDCVEESDMQLFMTKEAATNEMKCRMKRYISDPHTMFTFMKEESSDTCFVIADQLTPDTDDREGEFHICMAELPVTQEYSLYTWDGVEKDAHIMTVKEAVEKAVTLGCEIHDIHGNILFSKWDGWNGDYPAIESIWFPVKDITE